MAVFGAPRAHEDDPSRAVRAGLEMLDTVDDLPAAFGRVVTPRRAPPSGRLTLISRVASP